MFALALYTILHPQARRIERGDLVGLGCVMKSADVIAELARQVEHALSLVAAVLAMKTKENALTLPLALLWPGGGPWPVRIVPIAAWGGKSYATTRTERPWLTRVPSTPMRAPPRADPPTPRAAP